MRDSLFPLPSYLSLTGLKVNKMDGSAKEEEEEEDRAFTNISLADDTGKEETDDFRNIKFSKCSEAL